MNKRLATAFAAYAVLIGIACFALHGTALYAVLLVFLLFIARTFTAYKAGWYPETGRTPAVEEDADDGVR